MNSDDIIGNGVAPGICWKTTAGPRVCDGTCQFCQLFNKGDNMKKCYAVRFLVQGVTSFPLEMLTRERCYPANEASVGELDQSFDSGIRWKRVGEGGAFSVELVCITTSPGWRPSEAAWGKYSWKVVRSSTEEL